jgi:predicted Holliday junction resolvase-like endonuclease
MLIYVLFAILIILILSLIIYLARSNKIIQQEFQRQLEIKFDTIKNEIESYEKNRAESFLKTWQTENEVNIRRQAIASQTREITNEIARETKLLNESFSYNPRDIKFIGKYIDLIVFDGAADEEEVSIYFLEITKANNGSTSEFKNKVWAAINKRKFNWEEINF